MSSYRYRAARADGAVISGVIQASTATEASSGLSDRGLFPIVVAAAEGEPERHRAASRRDLAIVFHSVAALVTAGVPVERAIAASECLARGTLRETLAAARDGLRQGRSLAQALATRRGVVPGVVLGMIRAGERGSQLGTALVQVAAHVDQEAELVARVRQALSYPALLAVVGTVSVLVIATVIVPRFAELLSDLGQELPLATRVLIGGSTLLSRYWSVLIPALAAVAWTVSDIAGKPANRRQVEATFLSLPVLGSVRHALATARVARALGGMLRAGMPLLPALQAAEEAAGDRAVAARLAAARDRVAQGTPLTASLERESALLPSALQLFGVGELSGRLGEMALRAGDLAAQEAERGLKTLVTLVEPALILAFGGLVAFVAAALLQAVYSIRPGGF